MLDVFSAAFGQEYGHHTIIEVKGTKWILIRVLLVCVNPTKTPNTKFKQERITNIMHIIYLYNIWGL